MTAVVAFEFGDVAYLALSAANEVVVLRYDSLSERFVLNQTLAFSCVDGQGLDAVQMADGTVVLALLGSGKSGNASDAIDLSLYVLQEGADGVVEFRMLTNIVHGSGAAAVQLFKTGSLVLLVVAQDEDSSGIVQDSVVYELNPTNYRLSHLHDLPTRGSFVVRGGVFFRFSLVCNQVAGLGNPE
eukprot:m.408455 g.408455  ORF g.408455 m.408455 type:complete len:185 (+) comp56508_c0_seq24:233-787(+)